MCALTSRIAIFKFQIIQIYSIFNQLKLWVAVARHNFKWLDIKINLLRIRVKGQVCHFVK